MDRFINFSNHTDILIDVVVKGAALIGLFFIFRGLVKLKIYGEMRSMMAPHARINQILLLFFTGGLLVYFPHNAKLLLVDIFLGTPIISELPYHHSHTIENDLWLAAKHIVRLLGHIAMIRGIIQLGSYQEGGRHTLSKSFTHLIAGACAINIQYTLDLLNSIISVD